MTAHPDVPDLRLGRIQAPPDPRNLRLAAYTTPDLPAPPDAVNWLRKVKTWPMYGNDRVGDCEVCACAHAEQAFSVYGAGSEYTASEADVFAAYSAITGYDPATGDNDTGVRTLDMLGYWRTTGIGGRKITAYVEVNVRDRVEVKSAVALGGGLLVGVDMPLAAGPQFRDRRPWTRVGGADGRPGSWGGHAVHCGAYSPAGLACTTWGRTQRMSWGFWDAYVVEAFVPVSPAWFNQAGTSPTGLDLDTLLRDLAAVTSR
jgi:hypothetical protein